VSDTYVDSADEEVQRYIGKAEAAGDAFQRKSETKTKRKQPRVVLGTGNKTQGWPEKSRAAEIE